MMTPKSWKDITINQYIDLLPSATKGKSEFEAIYHNLKTLFGLSKEESRKLSVDDVERLMRKVEFINEAPSGKPVKKFRLNGTRYEVEINIKKHKADNYMLVMERLKELQRDPETVEKNLHLIMAVVCHPTKWSWKKFKYVKAENDLLNTAELFYNDMPISIAYPISVFFCVLSKSLTSYIQNYSTTKMETVEKELLQIKEDLQRSTGG